jgi:homoprotocatechuate degradation regulator HpaR
MADAPSRDLVRGESEMRPFGRSLPMALLRAREAVMRGFRRILREHGLNEQEWRIIRALMELEQIEIGELAERVFILKPSATRTIKNLQSRGLVTRSRSGVDHRRVYISLTDQAKELFHTLAPRNEAEYSRITQVVGPAQMQQLYDLLSDLTQKLNTSDEDQLRR